MKQASHHRGDDRVRRVGDDVEGSAGQAQISSVGSDDDDLVTEPAFEVTGPARVQLDGDDPGSRFHQRRGDGAVPGADVEDERPLGEGSVSDESSRCSWSELMPAPPLP